MKIKLQARNSAPHHCRECDGPLVRLPGRDWPSECSECRDLGLRDRLRNRYCDDQGIAVWFTRGAWEITREFHPLRWLLALDVGFDEPVIGISIGPWSIFLGKWDS